MATYYVRKTGNDDDADAAGANAGDTNNPYLTINGIFGVGGPEGLDGSDSRPDLAGGDVVLIGDGTYSELIDIPHAITLKSESGSAASATISTASNGRLIEVPSAGSGASIEDLTITYTGGSGNYDGAIICSSAAVVNVRRCVISTNSAGVYFPGTGSIFDRCSFTSTATTSTYNYGILSTKAFTATSCFFINFMKYAISATLAGNGQTISNCTVIVPSGRTATGGMYINGDGTGGPSLANTLIYNAGTMSYGIRVQSASDVCVIKNNLVYNDGGTLTVTSEYYSTAGSTTAGNWSTDHSSETEADATVDSGEDIFDNYGSADYHPNSDGSASGNGLASLAPSVDYAGDSFASPPAIGCYATAASGWSAGASINGVATGNIASINATAKANIASINSV